MSVLKQALKLAITLEFVDKEYCSNLKMPSSEEKEISVFNKKEQLVIESFCLNHKKRNYMGTNMITIIQTIVNNELYRYTFTFNI